MTRAVESARSHPEGEMTETPAQTKTDGARAIIDLLEDREVPVTELLGAASELAVSVAWSRGDIEFGSRSRVVNGKPGSPDCRLIVEPTWDWTGPKTTGRVEFRRLWADHQKTHLPTCGSYWEYPEEFEPDPRNPQKSPLREITRARAGELLTLYVKLTDKGLAALQAA